MPKDRPVVVEVVIDNSSYAAMEMPPQYVVLDWGTGLIHVGEKFALVKYTDQIIHPQTKENLGYLELVVLTGEIVNVQERMSLLKPDIIQKDRTLSFRTHNWRNELIGLEGKRLS